MAFSRATGWLSETASFGILSMDCTARKIQYLLAEEMASLDDFIDSLLQRGVPAEWIEEVLGVRLDVASGKSACRNP